MGPKIEDISLFIGLVKAISLSSYYMLVMSPSLLHASDVSKGFVLRTVQDRHPVGFRGTELPTVAGE